MERIALWGTLLAAGILTATLLLGLPVWLYGILLVILWGIFLAATSHQWKVIMETFQGQSEEPHNRGIGFLLHQRGQEKEDQ